MKPSCTAEHLSFIWDILFNWDPFFSYESTDDYAKDGGSEDVWLLCSFFSDIFSRRICSTVAETIGVTNYAASFGAKKCSENHIWSCWDDARGTNKLGPTENSYRTCYKVNLRKIQIFFLIISVSSYEKWRFLNVQVNTEQTGNEGISLRFLPTCYHI